MGQWPVSMKIYGPFLIFMGHFQNLMRQKRLFNHTDSRHLVKNGLLLFEMYVLKCRSACFQFTPLLCFVFSA